MPTPPRRHPRRLATTSLTEPGALPALARERFLPRPPDHWRPWFWLAAFLLHVVAIAALLYFLRAPRLQEAFEPTGMSVVVFDSGATQAQSPRQAPIPTPSQAPPPAPPPAAPAQAEPEVNLNLPMAENAPMPESLPQPSPPAPPQPHHITSHQHTQHYVVMNNMSLSAPPAPPSQFANKALNLNIGGADELPANTPLITIQGHIGTDWQAGFNKWVNDHIYYPDAAAEQGQQGAATIEFTVHRDGHVTGVHLLKSAGSPFLDQAWLGIFLQNNVPPFPPDETSNTIKITATLNYVLTP
jgi:protein TonB